MVSYYRRRAHRRGSYAQAGVLLPGGRQAHFTAGQRRLPAPVLLRRRAEPDRHRGPSAGLCALDVKEGLTVFPLFTSSFSFVHDVFYPLSFTEELYKNFKKILTIKTCYFSRNGIYYLRSTK